MKLLLISLLGLLCLSCTSPTEPECKTETIIVSNEIEVSQVFTDTEYISYYVGDVTPEGTGRKTKVEGLIVNTTTYQGQVCKDGKWEKLKYAVKWYVK